MSTAYATTTPPEPTDALADRIHVPGAPAYQAETSGANTAVACRPDLVVAAQSEDDVRAALLLAGRRGLDVHVRATGHGAHHEIAGGLLVSTRHLGGIAIDPTTSIATIGAGATWGEVVAAAAPLGLAPVCGTSPDVGVVGYLLGGGLGPLARSHGYGTDYLEGARLVTWRGDLVETSATENPDLLWAMRGGSPSLGVVTQVRVRLVRLAHLYGGHLTFAADSMDDVFRAWATWTATADPRVTTTAAFTRPPEPAPRSLSIHCAFPGPADEGAGLVASLRELGPVGDTLRELALDEAASIFDDPRGAAPTWSQGLMLASFDDMCAEALLDLFGSRGTMPFVKAQVRHLGGAVTTDVPGGSPAPGRRCPFILGAVGLEDPALGHGFAGSFPVAFGELSETLAPWSADELTANFAGRRGPSWTPAVHDRLRAVERTLAARPAPPVTASARG